MSELRRSRELAAGIRDLAARAARALPPSHGARRTARRRVARPVDYMRYAEFEAVLRDLDLPSGSRVLDIGSPQWFTLQLASSRQDCTFEYVNIIDTELDDYREIAQALGLGNVSYERADVCELPFEPGSFDRVISISVLEHVYPEVGGDIAALGEIKRVLAAGGELLLTVPFKAQRNVVYVDGPVYERAEQERNFFAREYDREMLDDLLAQSGFAARSEWHISERPGRLAVDYHEWGPGSERRIESLALRARRLLELGPGRSVDGWLAERYLRVSREPRERLVNIAGSFVPA
ncbi:MAG TPA: class I SAM-dependent methyltransferase [Gaiellaceae bacterium]|nr:class I SAM-dependent methyltransferase [Gaiellaceae bacterium]